MLVLKSKMNLVFPLIHIIMADNTSNQNMFSSQSKKAKMLYNQHNELFNQEKYYKSFKLMKTDKNLLDMNNFLKKRYT